jgi:hypothetical protein
MWQNTAKAVHRRLALLIQNYSVVGKANVLYSSAVNEHQGHLLYKVIMRVL